MSRRPYRFAGRTAVLTGAASGIGEQLAHAGGRVVVDLDDAVVADPEQRHALVRITREAVSNAIRHGAASRIHIRLTRTQDARRLVSTPTPEECEPATA